jgi:hypothetical protein
MPRIPPKALDLVFYLYHRVEDAREGRDFGGTGFFVEVPSRVPSRRYFYAVTNWHVACEDGASVIRLNTKGGGTDIFEFGPEEWEFDPRFDIAVMPIALNPEVHAYSVIPAPEGFVMQENLERAKLGPGDDVFMVGRFVDHDGGAVNRPAARFGNISVMPSPIEQPNGKMADSYCIDLHSRSGYSGSPVFVYRTPGGWDLSSPTLELTADTVVLTEGPKYLALLGIHFAQFPEKWELARPDLIKTESSAVPLIREGAYVKGLSGMTCVLPAWCIYEVLDMPNLKQPREAAEAQLEE